MQVDMTIWNCHQLRRINAVDFQATLDLGQLGSRSKSAVLFALKNGWIRSGWHAGAGLIAHKLMVQTGVFFVATRLRKGRNKWSNYQYVDWRWRAPVATPAWFAERIRTLWTADQTAVQVGNVEHTPHYADERWMPFYVLRLQDHLPGVFADYVATEEYRAAVAPLIEAVEEGRRIAVSVAPPKGRSWRS